MPNAGMSLLPGERRDQNIPYTAHHWCYGDGTGSGVGSFFADLIGFTGFVVLFVAL